MSEKFYVLIVKKEFDNLDVASNHLFTQNTSHREMYDNSYRSRSYTSRKEAEEKATEYLMSGRTEQYFVMECVGVVRKKPVDIEKISFRK